MSLLGYDLRKTMLEFVESIDDDEPMRAWRSSLRIAAASLSRDKATPPPPPPPLLLLPFVVVFVVVDATVVTVISALVTVGMLALLLMLLPTAIWWCGARCALFADGPSDGAVTGGGAIDRVSMFVYVCVLRFKQEWQSYTCVHSRAHIIKWVGIAKPPTG